MIYVSCKYPIYRATKETKAVTRVNPRTEEEIRKDQKTKGWKEDPRNLLVSGSIN